MVFFKSLGGPILQHYSNNSCTLPAKLRPRPFLQQHLKLSLSIMSLTAHNLAYFCLMCAIYPSHDIQIAEFMFTRSPKKTYNYQAHPQKVESCADNSPFVRVDAQIHFIMPHEHYTRETLTCAHYEKCRASYHRLLVIFK